MNSPRTFIISLTIASVTLTFAFAGPPGEGHAAGSAAQEGGRMSDDFRGVIHSLFAEHDQVDRSVELTGTGYRATTTSVNPEVAAFLRKHVSQMESRLEDGFSVRHWDPAFVELREHYDDMSIELEDLDNGVSVSVIGKTPEAIKVAQNHARIISSFVDQGEKQMHATHAAVVTKSDTESDITPSSIGGGCETCRGAKGKGGCQAEEASGDDQCGKGDKPCCAARAGKAEAQPKPD